MSIYERDYYKEKREKIQKQQRKKNLFIWSIVIVVILSLILTSLRF